MVSEKEQLTDPVKFGIVAPSPDIPRNTNEQRLLYHQSELNTAIQYEKPKHTFRKTMQRACKCNPLAFLYRTIPILYWLPKYKWRSCISGDLMAGITVAIMNIPQGMAYGLLGNVAPVVGIYMAFFPVLMYTIFGTSPHVSMGTFGIVCLMTGKVVAYYGADEFLAANTNVTHNPELGPDFESYTNLQVAVTITFTVAMVHFVMYIFRLGIVANLLSETLVNGLTCACAFHVVGSQLKDLFGLPIAKRRGYFTLPLTLYDSVMALPLANKAAVSMSLICIVCMVINNEIIKPIVAKKTKIPIPIELLAVVLGTAVSYFGNFSEVFNITVVGHLPTGFPEPALPQFSLIRHIFTDSLMIAIISYVVTMSMALMLAQKNKYEIDGNQELLALGISNTVGSMFSCMPITASLSRSVIQEAVGGASQLASVVSCLILMCVLLWIGPMFSFLPKCFLASIIVVALKSLYMQVQNLPKFWRMSKWDGILWLLTFVTTTTIAIDIGLGAGVLLSIINLFYHGQYPYTCLLGSVPNTDLYLDMKRFKGAQEIAGIKIFHYCGSLNFATKAMFKHLLMKTTEMEPQKFSRKSVDSAENAEKLMPTKCIILDLAALTFIDPSGVTQLKLVQTEFKEKNVEFYVAGCSGPVYETLRLCDVEANKGTRFQVFPRVHDAVMFAKLTFFTENES